MPSTLLVKTIVVVDCCMFACIGNDLQLLTKAVGLIYASRCTLLYFVVLVRRRRAIGAVSDYQAISAGYQCSE